MKKRLLILSLLMTFCLIVSLTACGGKKAEITSVSLNYTAKSVEVGKSFTLVAAVVADPDEAGNKKVGWSSANTAIATVDANGKVTGVAVGTTSITATSTVDSEKKAVCVISVMPASDTEITSVTLSDSAKSVEVSANFTLVATVVADPDEAANKEVEWTSSNPSVATVDSTGKVTGVSAGTATITATSTIDSDKKATCTVTVTAAPVGGAKSLNTVKTYLENNGWTVSSESVGGISSLVAIKSGNALTVLFCGSKTVADSVFSTYESVAATSSYTCKQNDSNIYYGTAAGIAAYEAA